MGHRGNRVGPYTSVPLLQPVDGQLGVEIFPEGMRMVVDAKKPLSAAALAALSEQIGFPVQKVESPARKKKASGWKGR